MLKEKNTVGHVKNEKMRKTELVPNISVGEFVWFFCNLVERTYRYSS
jgi:hypothetical protein